MFWKPRWKYSGKMSSLKMEQDPDILRLYFYLGFYKTCSHLNKKIYTIYLYIESLCNKLMVFRLYTIIIAFIFITVLVFDISFQQLILK